MTNKLSIRDFIYLDADRLKSILSQIDEGLLEKVDKKAGKSGSGQVGAEATVPFLAKFGGTGTYVASSEITETRTLHDHIYNYVEEKLLNADALFVLDEELTATEWLDDKVRRDVNPTAFILVRGRILINDFGYMKSFLSNFNDVAAALTRLANADKIKATPDHLRKDLLNQLIGPNQLQKGQQEDLRNVLEAFVRNNLIVRVLPFGDNPEARVVTNLDNPAALRVSMDSLGFRYGSAPRDEWTLFGQMAAVPLSSDTPFKFSGLLGAELDKAMQGVFNILRNMEPLVSSVVYPEICVVPIALYRG